MIVKASSGPRYVVGCRSKVDKEKLTSGTRVVLDMTTLTIMRALPREVSTFSDVPWENYYWIGIGFYEVDYFPLPNLHINWFFGINCCPICL